jgi:predicted RNase H-like nuclease (RuvC/YqgF family)
MHGLSFRWRSHPSAAHLEHTIDQLRTENIKLRHDLQTKQTQVGGLKLALQERMQRVDELANTIAVLRDQNRRLDAEAEHYFKMLAAD